MKRPNVLYLQLKLEPPYLLPGRPELSEKRADLGPLVTGRLRRIGTAVSGSPQLLGVPVPAGRLLGLSRNDPHLELLAQTAAFRRQRRVPAFRFGQLLR